MTSIQYRVSRIQSIAQGGPDPSKNVPDYAPKSKMESVSGYASLSLFS